MTQDTTLGALCSNGNSQQEILIELLARQHHQQDNQQQLIMFSSREEQQQSMQNELISSESEMLPVDFNALSEDLLGENDANLYLNSNSEAILKNIPSSDLINLHPLDIQTLANEESFNGNFGITTQVKVSTTIETMDVKSEQSEDVKKPILLNYVKNPFPKLEEHDDGKYGFEMNLQANTSKSSKQTTEYSPKLNKIFITANSIMYVDAVYSEKAQLEQNLYLRVMMVFIDEISSTVRRCANHMDTDNSEDCIKYNMIRCVNSNVQYLGKHDDQNDRLCILIPLVKMKPDLDGLIKQSIGLKFLCKNSCVGRRQTALIFTLENEHRVERGKRFINVRVCSCPKRDRKKDEEEHEKKRKGDESVLPPGKKLLKPSVKVKEEPNVSFPLILSATKSFDLAESVSNPDNDLELRIRFPDKELKRKAIDYIYDSFTGRLADDDKLANDPEFKSCFKTIKKLRASFKNPGESVKDNLKA